MTRIAMFFLAMVALLLVNSSYAQAQTGGFVTAELQTADAVPNLSMGLGHTFEKSTFGVSAFALTSEGFSEIYTGPSWAPAPWLAMSLSVGAQSLGGKLSDCYAGSVWLGGESVSSLTILEWNRPGEPILWYDHITSVSIFGGLALGIHARRFIGSGLMATYAIGSTGLLISASWMPWDPEAPKTFAQNAGLIGVSWSPN